MGQGKRGGDDNLASKNRGNRFYILKGQCQENFLKLRLRLGPTDVPLLTSVYCPFNLLRSFKDHVRRSKTDFV